MKFIKAFFINFFKFLVVILAVGNLIALFVFEYKIPDFLQPAVSEFYPEEATTEIEEVPAMPTFQINSDPLSYSGNSSLNLLEGVSLVNTDGSISNSDIFVHIKTGTSLTQKIIEYTADTPHGQISAERKLELKNYSGPKLEIPDSLPAITEEQLDTILSAMPTDGTFYADDGYGKDITNAVTVEYTVDLNDPSIIHYIFSITNSFNDTVAISADLTLERTRPVILLSTDSVTIKRNEEFNPLEFIILAEDTDGTSLLQDVKIDGELNLRVPGRYTLTYTVTSDDKITSLPQTLTVIIQPD